MSAQISETFAIVGAGRIGITLGLLLKRGGHRLAACSTRTAAGLERAVGVLGCPGTTDPAAAAAEADRILLAVPDGSVEEVCSDLAEAGAAGPGRYVVHTAGSLGLAPLATAADAGAGVLAIHPLQSVPDPERGLSRIPGSWFGITCHDELRPWAERFVAGVGGRPIHVPEAARSRYHAAASIASNFLVTLAATAAEAFGDLAPYLPLMRGTIENLEALGPRAALTGPIVRGDVSTVARHLAALEEAGPPVASLYRALAIGTLRLARARDRTGGRAGGGLADSAAEALEGLLGEEPVR